MFIYFFPLFGAILADSILGKYHTIFYVSIIYAVGQFLLALSAAPPLGLPPRLIFATRIYLFFTMTQKTYSSFIQSKQNDFARFEKIIDSFERSYNHFYESLYIFHLDFFYSFYDKVCLLILIRSNSREFALLGLFLIAIGSGGIKPCVSAFGGDQFVLPQQEQQLSTFFSVFYFSINSGSVISSFLTPILRSDVTCFGDKTCYSLSFLIPAILMSISIGNIIFKSMNIIEI